MQFALLWNWERRLAKLDRLKPLLLSGRKSRCLALILENSRDALLIKQLLRACKLLKSGALSYDEETEGPWDVASGSFIHRICVCGS